VRVKREGPSYSRRCLCAWSVFGPYEATKVAVGLSNIKNSKKLNTAREGPGAGCGGGRVRRCEGRWREGGHRGIAPPATLGRHMKDDEHVKDAAQDVVEDVAGDVAQDVAQELALFLEWLLPLLV